MGPLLKEAQSKGKIVKGGKTITLEKIQGFADVKVKRVKDLKNLIHGSKFAAEKLRGHVDQVQSQTELEKVQLADLKRTHEELEKRIRYEVQSADFALERSVQDADSYMSAGMKLDFDRPIVANLNPSNPFPIAATVSSQTSAHQEIAGIAKELVEVAGQLEIAGKSHEAGLVRERANRMLQLIGQ